MKCSLQKFALCRGRSITAGSPQDRHFDISSPLRSLGEVRHCRALEEWCPMARGFHYRSRCMPPARIRAQAKSPSQACPLSPQPREMAVAAERSPPTATSNHQRHCCSRPHLDPSNRFRLSTHKPLSSSDDEHPDRKRSEHGASAPDPAAKRCLNKSVNSLTAHAHEVSEPSNIDDC